MREGHVSDESTRLLPDVRTSHSSYASDEQARARQLAGLYPLALTGTINSALRDYGLEELAAGYKPHGGISRIRRLFCLFVTFDLLLSTLMWVLCFMITATNIVDAVKKEVLKYSIKTSFFDIVMSASARFVLLILMYGVIKISHWWMIAITTASTSAFLMSKVFLYEWLKHTTYMFDVFVLLISFVVTWTEAWFLDFRVLPQEKESSRFFQGLLTEDSRLANGRHPGPHYGSAYPESSVGTFFSPCASMADPEEEEISRISAQILRYRSRRDPFTPEEEVLRKKSRETLDKAWNTINKKEWNIEKTAENGDIVYSLKDNNIGKVFKLSGQVRVSPKKLLEELFYNGEEMPKWNPSVKNYQLIQIIDEHTDISHQVTAEGGGGVVSPRDFVTLRHWTIRDHCYVIASESIAHPAVPPRPPLVRGENGPSCLVMSSATSNPSMCDFQWLICTNLKGWLPKYVVDAALCSTLLEYMNNVRRRCEVIGTNYPSLDDDDIV